MKYLIMQFALFVLSTAIVFSQNRIELNTELMNSTFKIQGSGSIGTAFILGKQLNDSTAKYVLVTADHVLRNMKGEQAIIYLRKKVSDNYDKIEYNFQIRDKEKQLWVKHSTADVAAMYIPLPSIIKISILSTEMLGTDDIYNKIDIHPGDEFSLLGYPLGQEANRFGFPIARKGIIASYPIVPAKSVGTYLLDIKIFKGNSGGPVYFAQSGRTYRGALHSETTQFIAGLVSQERLHVTQDDSPYKTSVEFQQLYLAEIVPAVFIKETLDMLP